MWSKLHPRRYQCDVISILEIGHAGAISRGRAKIGAVNGDVAVKAISLNRVVLRGAALLHPSQETGVIDPPPTLIAKLVAAYREWTASNSVNHAAVEAPAAKNLP